MKLGIIGLPGAGKTTLFETLTGIVLDDDRKQEDRIGTIKVPDEHVDSLSNMYNPKKTIYAQVEYLLPRKTANKPNWKKDETVWSSVRTCDALIHVVRNFKSYGFEEPWPAEDFASLELDMIFTDLLVVEKRLERLEMDGKRGRKVDPEEVRLLTECREMLEQEEPLRRNPELAGADLLKGFTFLSAKPLLVIFNNDDEDDSLPKAGKVLEQERCLAIRARLERELSQMPEEEAREYLQEFGISDSAMDLMIRVSYELLGLISFFTVGEDEVRAWTIRRDTAASEAAGVIHSDIQKGFIRAEVLAYDDLMAAGSYKEARKNGTVRLEGKTYPVHDVDIIEFRFNV
ncbi:MAG: redox-regulated ATPase YchF [Deltaproteobacteria bacterium]|nr:redox-regulated ATPase YchF [Deltaproteobacteria bacterium]MBW2142172.1 redox-regulated ATPase YchF [Deltaproteobacteria bacterium]